MSTKIEDYVQTLIRPNDEMSKQIAAYTAPTLKNRKEMDIVNNIPVIAPDGQYNMAVFSCEGNPTSHADSYVKSFVDSIGKSAKEINGDLIAFTNIVCAQKTNKELADYIGPLLKKYANENNAVVINGESAQLKERVGSLFNMSGMGICHVSKDVKPGTYTTNDGLKYIVFSHDDMPTTANCDGQGTKAESNERTRIYRPAVHDMAAMCWDDTIKIGAVVKGFSATMEQKLKHDYSYNEMNDELIKLGTKLNIPVTLSQKVVGERISGYGKYPFNLDASVACIIDENRLKNLPRTKEGDVLIAVHDPDNINFRSNGITFLRQCLEAYFGPDWHKVNFEGVKLGKLVSAPSTIFYPVYQELLQKDFATGFYHMSGGSHRGKLAKLMAKEGLFLELNLKELFEPSKLMTYLIRQSKTKLATAYETWPMGNDGYISVRPECIDVASYVLKAHGLEGRVVGQAVKHPSGLKGVVIHKINGGYIDYLF